jgi:hypothetical protein
VLVKKEIRLSKMDNEFEEIGLVINIVGDDVYEIKIG